MMRPRAWLDIPSGPLVVGLESGGDFLGVALLRLSEQAGPSPDQWCMVDEVISHRGRHHADTVLGVLDAMLRRHGLEPNDIALVGVGRGPGGFTGVRVGLATAVGLGMGLDIPTWPVDSLLVLARNAAGPSNASFLAVPLIDARKGQVFGGAYRLADAPSLDAEVVVPASVGSHTDILETARSLGEPLVVFGSGAQLYGCASQVPGTWHQPSALEVALLAAWDWEKHGRPPHGPALDPAYIRPSDAELNEKRRSSR